MNTLYYGDNLNILRRYIKDESVDLVYLDPPFNSNRNYNVLFKDESGVEADSQITAFEDTWHWAGAAKTYHELILEGDKVSEMLQAFYGFIGTNQMMAYLVMMAVRLKELHRVLKPTGSLYLHCDPTASHYLKLLLDTIFGPENFRNEIIWKRTSSHNDSRRFASINDCIFYYGRTGKATWNAQFMPHNEQYLKSHYNRHDSQGRRYRLDNIIRSASMGPRPNLAYEYKGFTPEWGWRVVIDKLKALDENGRIEWSKTGTPYLVRYLDEMEGAAMPSLWDDIPPINSQAQERLGYPTQKPVALLERIIQASSNEGDVVLDPFAGCGTTIAAAQKLNRQWIGIDVTQLSIALLKNRLEGNFGMLPVGTRTLLSAMPPKAAPDAESSPTSSGSDAPAADKSVRVPSYRVIGEPEDLHDAKKLATEDRYQFQYWALSQIRARPLGGQVDGRSGKKGADKGIDGIKVFTDDTSGKTKRVIVQVKSGHVNSALIRDLVGTIQREEAAIGVFLTLEPATKPMIDEAASAGYFHSEGWHRDYPRMQILTVEEVLAGKQIEMPPSTGPFKQAEKLKAFENDQGMLGFES